MRLWGTSVLAIRSSQPLVLLELGRDTALLTEVCYLLNILPTGCHIRLTDCDDMSGASWSMTTDGSRFAGEP